MKSKKTYSQFRIIFFLVLFSVLNNELKAQVVVDTFNLPAGYTIGQLKFKNVLKVDSSNNVWVGFRSIGAGKFDGTNWTVYDTANGLPSVNVLSFAFSGNDTWVGTDSGLAKYNGSSWTIFNSSNSGLTSDYIQSLFIDGNTIWIGTKDGAFKFDGTNWTHYSTSNSGLPADTVNCFAKSGNDTIWIGTNNGLAKFFNGNWTTYNLPNNVSPFLINEIVADGSENIWMESHPDNLTFETRILYQDSISSLSRFFSFCHHIPEGILLRTNTGNIVNLNSHAFEINLSLLSAWEANVLVNQFNAVADIDSQGKIWIATYSGPQKLLSMNYHSYLQPLVPGSDCYTLDINQVRAPIYDRGDMFWDLIGNGEYEVPKGSGLHSIFADAFWIGGMDASNKLHLAAQTYRQNVLDFWPGPLDTTNATLDSTTMHQYDLIWKIDRFTVDQFISQFALGNVTNGSYTVPDVILHWPAQGSGNYSRKLAPFVDYNHDGIYNPYDGDYPEIKGHQMLWFVFNDVYTGYHGETGGKPLGIEIHGSAYAYNCPSIADSDEAINYTTFFHYEVFNRSDTSYSQVYMGRFTDMDLGSYLDDYVGCDTTLNIGFTYNGDNYDDGITGYGSNPPIQNILYLSDTMTHFLYYNNNGDPVSGNPVNASDYYNYMHSVWRDSSHVTYGGNGHGGGLGSTTTPTNFMFSGNPYGTPTGWNEVTAGNVPDDRRLLTSTGPFNFPAHSEKDFDFAYVWTRDPVHPNGLTTSWAKNVHDVLKIKQWYAADSFPCINTAIGIHEIENTPIAFTIYPNPASHQLTIFAGSKKTSFYEIEISDVTGRKIKSGIIFTNRNNNINIEGISSGIYFVKISDKEIFSVKKFIKD